MKAAVWTAYGTPDVLQLREIEKPEPQSDEILVRIFASTVTTGDCEQRSLDLPLWYMVPMRAYVGIIKPERITILGMDFSGEVEAIGRDVHLFHAGDQVFGSSGILFGTNAEYLCLPEQPEGGALAIKPVNMSYEQAAAVPVGGLEALSFLKQGNIQSGQQILINGAGGTIGIFALQLAKHFGAEVTAVDSTQKLDTLRSLGADQVVDYTRQDFTRRAGTYDLILDIVSKGSFSGCMRALKAHGCYLVANPGPAQIIMGRWNSLARKIPGFHSTKEVKFGKVSPRNEDLEALAKLIEAGELTPVIDRCYPLEQTAEAHRYVETDQKVGNVVITSKH